MSTRVGCCWDRACCRRLLSSRGSRAGVVCSPQCSLRWAPPLPPAADPGFLTILLQDSEVPGLEIQASLEWLEDCGQHRQNHLEWLEAWAIKDRHAQDG